MTVEMSADCTALFDALSHFQGEVGAPRKESENPHFRSKFADLAEVIATAKPVLAKHGLALTQLADGSARDGVTITTMLTHKSGQWIRSSLTMPLDKPTPQAVGSSISYARRYAAMAILGIAADDDDAETAEGRGKGPQKQAASAQKPEQKSAERKPAPAQSSAQAAQDGFDEYGLRKPKSPCPKFSDQAQKYAGKLWSEPDAAWLVAKNFAERGNQMTAPQREWAEYIVERRAKRKEREEQEAAERARPVIDHAPVKQDVLD